VGKKAAPKFEFTPQLIGVAVALLLVGILVAWFLSGDSTGPNHGDVPDIRDTKQQLEK
jgi:hypothetical protein